MPEPPADDENQEIPEIWDLLRNTEITDNQYKAWELRLKIIGVVGVLVAFFVGLQQYRENVERTYKQEFWKTQLSLYVEASKSAATLASIPREDVETRDDRRQQQRDATIRFWQLYYGDLALVEDKEVESAMKQFGDCLRLYDEGLCSQVDLRKAALEIARQCRYSIGDSWKIHLDELMKIEDKLR